MKHFAQSAKYEAQLTLHEAELRAMKRSLFRLHVFFARNLGKKNGRGGGSRTRDILLPKQAR